MEGPSRVIGTDDNSLVIRESPTILAFLQHCACAVYAKMGAPQKKRATVERLLYNSERIALVYQIVYALLVYGKYVPLISKITDEFSDTYVGSVIVGPFADGGVQYNIAHDVSGVSKADGTSLKETLWAPGPGFIAAFAATLDSPLLRTVRDSTIAALRRIGTPGVIVGQPPEIDQAPRSSSETQLETALTQHVLPDSERPSGRAYIARFDVRPPGTRATGDRTAHRAEHPLVLRLDPGETGQTFDYGPRVHLNALLARYHKMANPEIPELSNREIAALTECVIDAMDIVFIALERYVPSGKRVKK